MSVTEPEVLDADMTPYTLKRLKFEDEFPVTAETPCAGSEREQHKANQGRANYRNRPRTKDRQAM